MPILADFVTPPSRPLARLEDWRRLEFQALNGVDLIQWSGWDFILNRGTTGLDVPPRDLVESQYPGLDGARLEEIRTLPRDVFMPLMLLASDGSNLTLRKQLGRLRRYLDYRGLDLVQTEGTFDLAAVTPSSRRTLRCSYVDGMEGTYSLDAESGRYWQRYGVRLRAVDPYWHGSQWSTPLIGASTAVPFLSSNPAAHPWGLAPSVVLGSDIDVFVDGDVASPPVADVTGPSSGVHISSPQGLDVTISALDDGQQVRVISGRHRNVLTRASELDEWEDGWSLVGDSPRWADLGPGDTTISIVALDATAATSARVYGDSLWETAWA